MNADEAAGRAAAPRALAARTVLLPILPCAAIAGVSLWLGRLVPTLDAPILAILLGMAVANLNGRFGLRPFGDTGAVAKWFLQAGIVVIGASLDLGVVWRTGTSSLALLGVTIGGGLAFALVFGRAMGVPWRMTSLLAVGTVICGASAIAALGPVIRARAEEMAYAISVIFLFNLVAVLVFPGVGHLLALSDHAFGLWAGSAVNDTSAAVAAGYAYSPAAGDQATIVKLTRTTMIVPLVLLFALWTAIAERRAGAAAEGLTVRTIARGLPLFLVLFLVGALLNSAGLFGAAEPALRPAGRLLLLVALAAVGLQARFATAVRMGARPILLGLGTWAVVALASLAVQAATGRL